MSKKIGFFVGSLREGSYNKKVAEAFVDLLPAGYEAVFIEIGHLPFYNEDLETVDNVPDNWVTFREIVKNCQGYFFFTPEYNRSVPAALKNALDVGSRPYVDSVWYGKPALVVSASTGAMSGFGANHHLRQSLVILNMPTLQQPEAYIGHVQNLIEENGKFSQQTIDFFQMITDKYVEFFNKLTN